MSGANEAMGILEEGEKEEEEEGIHWTMGTLIFINALVGVGLLNFPASLHAAGGLLGALGVQAVMVALLFTSISVMVWAALQRRCRFYQDTVESYLGWAGKQGCVVAMLCFTFLLTSMYSTVISRQLRIGFLIISGADEGAVYSSSSFWLLTSMVLVIFPLCLVRSIGSLHHASAAATASLVFVVAIIVYEYVDTLQHGHLGEGAKVVPTSWRGLLAAVPAYSVAYMFDLCSVAVADEMKGRSMRNYLKASGTAVALVFVFFNTTAAFAYFTFGASIRSNFMENYTSKTALVAAAQLLFGLKLCLEYPIYQFLGWTALRSLVPGKGTEEQAEGGAGSDAWRALTSALWVGGTSLVAVFAEDVGKIIPLTAVVVIQFQFIFPALTLLAALRGKEGQTLHPTLRRVAPAAAVFFICLGVTLTCLVLYYFFVPPTGSVQGGL